MVHIYNAPVKGYKHIQVPNMEGEVEDDDDDDDGGGMKTPDRTD